MKRLSELYEELLNNQWFQYIATWVKAIESKHYDIIFLIRVWVLHSFSKRVSAIHIQEIKSINKVNKTIAVRIPAPADIINPRLIG